MCISAAAITVETTLGLRNIMDSQLSDDGQPLPNPVVEEWPTTHPVCFAKTSYTCRMNDLAKSWMRIFPVKFLP